MPLVRIDTRTHPDPTRLHSIGRVVYAALRSAINVPEQDNFQVLAEHDGGRLVYDPHYLGIARSDGQVFIQITPKRRAQPRAEKGPLPGHRRGPAARGAGAPGGCVHQPAGGEKGELVVWQWAGAVRGVIGLTGFRSAQPGEGPSAPT